MKTYRSDLHVHTVLSPCAAVEMIPPLIVQEALSCGIQLMAVTDHNASANAGAIMQAAAGTRLIVLPGMELQTREEVHMLCIFDNLPALEKLQQIVDQHLPVVQNDVELFGEQFVVDHEGEFIRREERLLINSVDISLENAASQVQAFGGLAIPAHINRTAYGLIAQLGLIPEGFDALEISRHIQPADARKSYPQIGQAVLIQNGDVHMLDGFLGSTYLEIEEPTIAAIRKALLGKSNSAGRVWIEE